MTRLCSSGCSQDARENSRLCFYMLHQKDQKNRRCTCILKGKCIDFSSRVQKKDNLISVRMAYLSLPYDKPNSPNRQLYTHVAIVTSAVMTYERLSSTTEMVDHCRNWSFSIVLLYSRCERSAVFNAVSAVNCLSAFSSFP